jgi:hypothetical protein
VRTRVWLLDLRITIGRVTNVRTKAGLLPMPLKWPSEQSPVLVMVTPAGERIAYVPGGCGSLGWSGRV